MNKFPTVDYVIHTTDKIEKLGPVKFRTFTFGEHRQFLEAQAIGDERAILETLLSIIEACTFGKVPVRQTEMYLLDMLYLQIFIKTKGAAAPATYKCTNEVKGEEGEVKECGHKVTLNVPLANAYIHYPEGYLETSVVKIGENSGIKLRQPTPDEYSKNKENAEKYEVEDQFLFSSIECIFDGDRVMVPGVDFDLPGLIAYVNTLPDYVMDQVRAFYETTPVLKLDLPVTCPKCKHTETIKLEGLEDFFG